MKELKYYWDLTCPEQYNIYKKKGDKEKIAYARYRWESFTVDCPDVRTNTVYENGALVDKVPIEWKLEAEEAIDKYYKWEQIKKDTIESVIKDYPKLNNKSLREAMDILYDDAFSDGESKCQQDILDEYVEKQGCKRCEHYKDGILSKYCDIVVCEFKEKVNDNKDISTKQ